MRKIWTLHEIFKIHTLENLCYRFSFVRILLIYAKIHHKNCVRKIFWFCVTYFIGFSDGSVVFVVDPFVSVLSFCHAELWNACTLAFLCWVSSLIAADFLPLFTLVWCFEKSSESELTAVSDNSEITKYTVKKNKNKNKIPYSLEQKPSRLDSPPIMVGPFRGTFIWLLFTGDSLERILRLFLWITTLLLQLTYLLSNYNVQVVLVLVDCLGQLTS